MSAGSLTSAEVDGMLQEVVAAALGPTPPSKRKAAPQEDKGTWESQEQRCPNVEAAAGSDDSQDMHPASKKPKLEPQQAPPAGAFTAAPLPTLVLPAPAAAAPALPACRPPSVDLEAAVGELLSAAEELLPSTQPAGEAEAAAEPPAELVGAAPAAAHAPTEPSTELTPTEPLLPTATAADVPASSPTVPPPTHPAASAPAATLPLAAPASVPAAPAACAILPASSSPDRLVRRPAPDSTQPSNEPATAPASIINMLKGDIEQDFSEPHSSGSPCSGDWTSGSSQEVGATPPSPSPPHPEHIPSPPPPRCPVNPPSQLADYVLQEGREVGSGGLGRVYAAVHQPTGRPVALKLGGSFRPEDGPDELTWTTFRTEWNTYARLATSAASASSADAGGSGGVQLPWLARPYEFGLWEDGTGGVAPWLTMSLLGPSLHALNQRHRPAVQAQLGGYARGMLAALEGLHRQGLIHNDIKPANFVVPHGFAPPSPPGAPQAGTGTGSISSACLQDAPVPQVFLIDFGFALKWDPSRAGGRYEFVGTPDFAASAALAGCRPGLRDDLEALGYTLLELALGDLPWDITKHTQPDSRGREREVSAWTSEALAAMLARRDRAWEAAAAGGRVPAWLVEWVEYCRALHPSAAPDYARLRRLIAEGEADAAAAAKAGARAASDNAWLGLGAEE
ncbi:hypothetical protein ABPG75_004092 [Micractinium tetrahymenae]